MKFLVRMVAHTDALTSEAELTALNAAETARGAELMRAGVIEQIWRVHGPMRSNVAIWNAQDRRTLDAYINSLPMRQYIAVTEVTVLEPHPVSETVLAPGDIGVQ